MYCKPANCYCAETLGDVNKFPIDDKIYYIRPENLNIVNHSEYSINVQKCFFQGREYKITGKFKDNEWLLYSKKPLKVNSEVFFNYSESDLIYFKDSNPRCFS